MGFNINNNYGPLYAFLTPIKAPAGDECLKNKGGQPVAAPLHIKKIGFRKTFISDVCLQTLLLLFDYTTDKSCLDGFHFQGINT